MSVNKEYCNPFEGDNDIWVKLEHCGRYCFACDFLQEKRCSSVLDLACADGYGSKMLSKVVPNVIAADKNIKYIQKANFKNTTIHSYCFDFDGDFPADMDKVDAVVCFETIEHLHDPFSFLTKITGLLHRQGWLLISFPNEKYERLNQDNTNCDPFHLHILHLEEVCNELARLGYTVHNVLGQPICNQICGMQHDLKEAGVLTKEEIDGAFHHDAKSILALSRLIAYPMQDQVVCSYSYLIIAKKR